MATYIMSPHERLARAQSLKERSENGYVYNPYRSQVNAKLQKKKEQAALEEEKNSQNFFVRGISTIGDIAANVIIGAVKGLEGIYDLGASIVGAVGGIFDEDFQNSVKSHVAYDWTSETIGNPLQELTKYSYTKDGGIIEGVASGIGQMLPAVAVSIATAGIGSAAGVAAGAASKTAQVASLATLGVSAAGSSTEEAFNDGADYYKGFGYGLASGAVEVATEKMFGGATKSLFGKGVLDNVEKSIADTGVKRIAKNTLKEGVEEVVSELANPALKGIYKGGEAFEKYKTADYWKGVAKAGAIGSLTALAYSGTVGYGMSKVGMGYVGKEADINDSLTEIKTQKQKADNLFANEKLTEKNEATITSNLKGNYQNIETALKKSNETKRADMIKKFSLESAFEADGSIKSDFASKIGLIENVEQVSEDTTQDGSKPLASLDKRYYAPSLRGSEQTIQEDLGKITANLQESENNIALEEGRAAQQISSVTPYIGELSDTGKASFTKVKKGLNYLNGKSGGKVNIVIVNPHESFNGNLYNDQTIYLGADTLENGKWAGTLVHEYTHFAEGSKDYSRLIKFIRGDAQLFETAAQATAKAGYMSSEVLDIIIDKIEAGKDLTADETRAYGTFQSEINAHMTEILLGNEAFIGKIVRGDTTIAEKVLNKINDLKAMLKSFDSKESRAEYKELEKAEKLYLKAVESAGYKYSNRKIIRTKRDEVDAEGEIQYNKNIPYIQWKSDALAWANDSKRKIGDMDSGADSGYYYFYEAFDPYDDGKTTDYRVVAKVKMSDETRIDEWFEEVKSNNERNSTSIYESIDEYENARKKYKGNDTTSLKQSGRNGQGDSLHQRKSEGNGERNSQSGSQGKQGEIRFSLKESVEKDILSKYGKTYRWVETGYIYKDGTKIDLSGRNEGAPGGYRTVDHRDIFDVYEDSDIQGSEAMVEFMARGNIRVMPESPGINLQVEPTEAQYTQIQNLVENLGWKEKEFSIDFDNSNGDTVDNLHYEGNISARKVISDIKYYFKAGKTPYKSEFSDFRYSRKEKDYESVLNNIDSFKTIEELKSYFNSVHEMINEESRAFYPHTMAELNDNEGNRIRRVANAVNLEKEAIKAFRKSHPNKPIVDLDTKKKIDEVDKQYSEAIKKNDTETAKNLVEQMALLKGYSVTDYQIDHKAPYNNGYDARLDDVTPMYGKDIYGNNAAQCFGTLEDFDSESIRHIQNAKGNPNKLMNIYRAVPTSVKNNQIRNGDWVTLTRAYAENHGKSNIIGNYRIITRRAKASEIYTDGNSIHEFGYDDGKQYYYRDTTNFRKIADAITFDDNGNPIKLKDRFNYRVDDIRYSRKDSKGNALTQEQIDFFKDSKARDNEGNLQVVYHGTNKEFFTFEMSKNSKRNVWGEGFYFAKGKGLAYDYGKNIIEAYLNIKNPYINGESNLGTAEYIKDKYFIEMWGSSRQLGIDYITNKLEHSPIDLLQFIAEENNKQVADILNDYGYDGIIDGSEIVAFDSNQIKLTSNQNPTGSVDIRFSKKEGKTYYKLTEGQLKKIIANNTKYKIYTLADSEAIINNVLSQYMSFGDKYGELSGKTKKQVIDMLWNGLNSADSGYQMNVALNIADYIIQNGVLENVWGDEDSGWAIDTIDILKPYLHSLDLNGIKGEIKHKYDTDNSPYLLWGKRRGSSGIAPDQLGQLLEETGLQIDAINEADIFIQIDDLYKSAVKALKKKAKSFLSEGLSSEEQKNLRQEIAREVLRGYDYAGGDSKLAGIVNKYTDRITVLKEQLQNEKVRNSVINRLLDKTQKLKDLKLGTFLNSTEFKSDIFKGSIEKLATIKFRGDLNQSGTRDIVKGLAEWYVESNKIVGEAYEKEIDEALNEITNGKGKLTTQELCNLTNIVDYFKHFVETYNKVLRNGQYVEAQPIAEGYIQTLRDNKAIKVGWFNKVSGSSYVKMFGDPMSVARRMDMYESGFYTEMLERLRESTVNAAVDEMDIRTELDEFLTKNKKYLKEVTKRKVKYLGNDIPLMEALYVYMALGRKQAQLGLEKSGFTFTQDKETIRVNGFDTEGKTAESAQNDILKQLNETDKKFIEIAKKIFNEECKDRKRKTDIARRGYSNVSEDEYIPIRRANVAKSVDTSTFKDEMDRVSNASFNKDTVQGAKQELIVEPLNEVLDRHIHAVAQYANLATTIDEYNKLFSLDISGNKNKPVSVATESRNTWNDGDEYFKKLISDIQGIPTSKGVGNRAMSFVRGNYAKYQLGFNPKVWLTQLSSFAAAGSILDVKSIIQGLGILSKDIDAYSALAKLRNKDNTAAMAQGVLSKPNKVNLTALNDFSDLLMKPIGVVDRFVVKKLFGACQVQVEKENSLKIGTAENKQKAAKLLNKVILETQQNFMATERSAAMRSGSEFMKTITMFSADAMKVVGRVIDSIGELTTLQARKKVATGPAKVAELEKRIKAAQKKTAKSVASLVTSAVLMALIAQLFRTLYNKDDEEDNIAQNMSIDAIGNLLGGLPIIRDIYSRFTQGYEISGYAYSALNDLLDTGVGIFETVGDIFSGKTDSKDIALNIKKLTYAGGQLLGLPTRNVYNIAYGLTKRFSPSAAYKIDDLFYNQSYSSDLAKAIENGDDSMIATITGIMLNENVGDIKEASVREEMNSLVPKGYSVLPRSIGDKTTYEGEEITLTNKQKEQFKTVYSEANSKVASLLNLSQYKFATEEVRAKAIKYIYDIYYNLALEDLLGVDLENKNLLFAEAIEIEKLAIIVASARELSAATDKNGRTVSGSKKAKVQAYVNALQLSAVQKYMIIGYLGYSNENGKNQVKGYIQRLSLSKTQKEQLFEYSGYAA